MRPASPREHAALRGYGVGDRYVAVLPQLTLVDLPASVTVTDLGDAPPVRRIVAVATRATASSIAVREFIRELRASAGAKGKFSG